MNYRHAFHAGNFADVMKHATLALLIERLKEKPAAFRVIDTHAGVGLYDLAGDAASRTGEWRNGIGRVFDATPDPDLAALLSPYLAVVKAANPAGGLRFYPGSPSIARHLLRRQDRLTAVELHAEDVESLRANFRDDRQVRVVALDGRLALGAFVPPKERRGLVLVDPPFEERDEFEALAEGFIKAHRRWPTGIYALWYPVKDLAAIDGLRQTLAASGIRRLTMAELSIRPRDTPDAFNGAGLILCNAPWRFGETLSALLNGLTPLLATGRGAAANVEELAGE
ncbi:MAG TPA: 23S rRNA (adenine(2030)-N(6))-methyltransferase RlmJ [Bauldia sp.]|nr:23S rRNA (adenine(2030)-N(6))-methyltransferase RlmJ [Bauldia sp.]